MSRKAAVSDSWLRQIGNEFDKEYMVSLRQFLKEEISQGKTIFPPASEVFSALNYTPFEEVKVVILGQDPYHGDNQAHGLSFSVKPGVRPPPSLQNIFKELKDDLGIEPPLHGFLKPWADQGVLLLNAVLTVERGKAGSHQGKGWEIFTNRIIEILNERPEPMVFVLWGAYAQKKGEIINRRHHLVLESAHPSPFSANRGFLGNKHFSKINAFLEANGQKPINWKLPELT